MHNLFLVIMMATLTAGTPGKATTTAPSASEILKSTAQTYASCKSYRDTGSAICVPKIGHRSFGSTVHFETAFARPDQFRFECSFEYSVGKKSGAKQLRHVIWTKKSLPYSWLSIDSKLIKEDSLNMALAKAGALSSTSSHSIPRLLMPDTITGLNVTDVQSPKLVGSVMVDGKDCYKVVGAGVGMDGVVTLFIDKRNYLIRKMLLNFKSPDFGFIVMYKPELDIMLPASAFESRVAKTASLKATK